MTLFAWALLKYWWSLINIVIEVDERFRMRHTLIDDDVRLICIEEGDIGHRSV